MNLVNKTIASLWGGVSQQPDNVRIENQCEEAINCSLSVVDGVGKRTPTNFLFKNNEIDENSKLFLIDKENEKYALVFNNNIDEPISIYDLNTMEKKILDYDNNALNYLLSGINNNKTDLSVLNLADNTIIVNKNVTCKMIDTYNHEIDIKTIEDEITFEYFEKNITTGDNLYFSIIDVDLGEVVGFNITVSSGDTIDDIKIKMDNELNTLPTEWSYTSTKLTDSISETCPEFKQGKQFYNWGDSGFHWFKFMNYNIDGKTGYDETYIFGGNNSNHNLCSIKLKMLFIQQPNPLVIEGSDIYYEISEVINKAVFVREEEYEYYASFYKWTSTYDCDNIIPEESRIKIVVNGKKNEITNLFSYKLDSLNNLSNFGDNTVALSKSEGIVNILKGVIKTDYTIKVGNTSVKVTTGDGTGGLFPKTTYISIELLSLLNSNTEFVKNYYARTHGNSIYIKNRYNKKFTIETIDSYGDTAMTSFTDRVNLISQLPNRAEEGYIVNVNPDAENAGGYYLKYKNGEWVETLKEFTNYIIDDSTMPVTLKENNGSFFLDTIFYERKKVGDDINTPNPLFINNKISEIFFYKNRLGFVSNDNLIFSRNDDYFNFFYKTATQVLDDDFISIASSDSSLPIIGIKPFNNQLISFTEKAQYNIDSGGQPFTPNTVSATRITTTDASKNCNLVNAGSNLYFASNSGDFSNIGEYLVQPDTLINDYANVTAHCPKYLPKDIVKIIYESNEDILFLKTNVSNEIYVYNFKWSGNKKVQSAWSKFQFDFDLIDFDIIGSEIYSIIKRNNQVELIKSSFSVNYDTFDIYLDRKVKVNSVINEGYVTLTIPDYNFDMDLTKYSVVDSRGFLVETEVEYVDSETIRFIETNDITDTYTVGLNYSMDMKFNTLNYKSQGTNIGETSGRLTIRKVRLSYSNTLNFQLYTEINNNIKFKNFNSYKLNHYSLDTLKLLDGNFDMSILKKNDKFKLGLKNDSHLPGYITSMSWIGILSKKTHTI